MTWWGRLGADSPGVSAGTLGFAAADQWSALREHGRLIAVPTARTEGSLQGRFTSLVRMSLQEAAQADGQWPSLRCDPRFRVGAGVLDGPFLPLAEASAPGGQGRQTLQSRTKQQADGRSPSACCLKWKQRDIIFMLPAHNSECRIPNSYFFSKPTGTWGASSWSFARASSMAFSFSDMLSAISLPSTRKTRR